MIIDITEEEARQIIFDLSNAKDVIEETVKGYETMSEYKRICGILEKITALFLITTGTTK